MGGKVARESAPMPHCGSADRAVKNVGRFSVTSRYHLREGHHIEDDYELLDTVLGSGCNGVVRLALGKNCTGQQQRYAVKAFKQSNLTKEKKEQLDSEVEVFLGMDHPHIARLYDVYETGDVMYLVMECLDGGELFDRVQKCKRFSEKDAAEATRQMLLALNYLHTHGIVHRDLKLENFLYDSADADTLKLIDFGFSRVWDANIKMHVSCGTLSYVAPEVLQKSYTKQCDMWSLGVVAFILLAGYMPFSGSEQIQQQNILAGKYTMKKDRWKTISDLGVRFVQALLQVNPDKRLTAMEALEHPWIAGHAEEANVDIDAGIVDGLMQFGKASKFRRCCMEMMAWSLSNEERARVRDYFVAMDANHHGTITLQELKKVMVDKFHIPEGETLKVFEALDSNHDETIHYTDFLAAMLNTRIALHEDLMRAAFRRFDSDNSGYITLENLQEVVGDDFMGETVEVMLAEADILKDNRISYEEFVAYLSGTPLQMSEQDQKAVVADKIIQHGLQRDKLNKSKSMEFKSGFWSSRPMLKMRRSSSKLPPAGIAPPGAPADARAPGCVQSSAQPAEPTPAEPPELPEVSEARRHSNEVNAAPPPQCCVIS